MLKRLRFGRFLCWLFYGHYWDKTKSRSPMRQSMNRCLICDHYIAGPD